MKILSLIYLVIFSFNTLANELKIGTKVSLFNQPSIFLGKAIKPNGEFAYKIYLNLNDKKIYYIDAKNFTNEENQEQKILDLYEQEGGTCTAYAIDDYLQQMNLSGFNGNGELSKILSSEEGRTQLLADSINQYYLTLQHRYSINGVLNGYGKKYGFNCNKIMTSSFDKAKSYILNSLGHGVPVLFSFNIGPKMYQGPFELVHFDDANKSMDNRLWLPRKIGERNSGGHSILAAASFEFLGKTYLVMIDSDWSEPRIWDLAAYLNDRTALDEMEFITCK